MSDEHTPLSTGEQAIYAAAWTEKMSREAEKIASIYDSGYGATMSRMANEMLGDAPLSIA